MSDPLADALRAAAQVLAEAERTDRLVAETRSDREARRRAHRERVRRAVERLLASRR